MSTKTKAIAEDPVSTPLPKFEDLPFVSQRLALDPRLDLANNRDATTQLVHLWKSLQDELRQVCFVRTAKSRFSILMALRRN